MLTYDDAFWKGAEEVLRRHKLSMMGTFARTALGAGMGAAGGLMMRDENEGAGKTLGRMAFGAGLGGLGGAYGPGMWNKFFGKAPAAPKPKAVRRPALPAGPQPRQLPAAGPARPDANGVYHGEVI